MGIFMTTTLYGIKNCDTVKKARNWLSAQNIDYNFHDFRADGLSAEQVNSWVLELGLDTLVNKRSTTWKSLDEKTKASLNEKTAVQILVDNPTLIKRPLLDTGKHKTVGFKAVDYQNIFAD